MDYTIWNALNSKEYKVEGYLKIPFSIIVSAVDEDHASDVAEKLVTIDNIDDSKIEVNAEEVNEEK